MTDLRYLLAIYVHSHQTGNSVPPHIDAEARAALAAEPPALALDASNLAKLREQWNAQADEFNQWDSLDSAEQLAWAQKCAIPAHEAALAAERPAPGPTIDDIWQLCEDHEFHLGMDGANEEESAEGLLEIINTALGRWGRPAPAEPDTDAVLSLAAIIRRVDGSHSLGAAALAEAILSHLRNGQRMFPAWWQPLQNHPPIPQPPQAGEVRQ